MLKYFQTRISSAVRNLIREELELREEEESKNIRRQLQRRGLQTTADYVERHMTNVDSVPTRFKLLDLALSHSVPDGLFCEFGVFSGTSINYIARRISSRVYGFDSFAGLPERWSDGFPAGHFARKDLPQVRGNVELITGWFHETLPPFLAEHSERISFLHIDCDLYSATKTVLSLLNPRIGNGTVIVFDEYFNYPGWQDGEFKAFHEFIDSSRYGYDYLGYNRNDEQAAVIITSADEHIVESS